MSDEKDRFGEKLRDKQRGDEDRYFAQRDREQLEKLRTQKPAARCPRDGSALVEREHIGIKVDDCPTCGGIWLDKGELEHVIERNDEGWAQRWLRSVLSIRER